MSRTRHLTIAGSPGLPWSAPNAGDGSLETSAAALVAVLAMPLRDAVKQPADVFGAALLVAFGALVAPAPEATPTEYASKPRQLWPTLARSVRHASALIRRVPGHVVEGMGPATVARIGRDAFDAYYTQRRADRAARDPAIASPLPASGVAIANDVTVNEDAENALADLALAGMRQTKAAR